MKINCHRAAGSRGQGTAGLAVDPRRAAGASSRRGIALVITLIMLSVTLVMAIAFLALARRERNAVSTTTDTTRSKLAADSALAAAQAQIMANILNTNSAMTPTNSLYNFGLLISTNYINTNGFVTGVADPANVNYDHESNSFTALNTADFIQNVANLQYLPRVPVFIQTNAAGSNDFRFYLDLNRNGQFDSTAYVDNSLTNGPLSEMGDPQWIGLLARPDTTHSPDNQFLSRYAFIAVPIGNGLDINAIHNQALNTGLNFVDDGYFRNEGVGSWEINLAAFLADLNTDEWDPVSGGYGYNRANNPLTANSGFAFEDAYSILTNRYASSYSTLAVPNLSFYNALTQAGIDGYTYGPLLTGTGLPFYNTGPGNSTPWVGSVNTNHFYDLPADLFNPLETSADFVNRLTFAGSSLATNYDRYTYYRLLAQMGTDSDPDGGKMNLNFRNITNGVVVAGMETNLYPWTPLDFFTNAADRMLRLYSTNWFASNPSNFLAAYYNLTNFNFAFNNYSYWYTNAFGNRVDYDPSGFGLTNHSASKLLGWTNAVPAFSITNIPVYVNGQFVYSPAINRILQMAANIYDASTNSFYPDVFRPIFEHDNLGNVFIVGYTNLTAVINGVTQLNVVNGPGDIQLSPPYNIASLTNWNGLVTGSFSPMNTNSGGSFASINAYGVPWIIGAKKGFPNFNKFGMQTLIQASRRLQITRSAIPTKLGTTTFQTNQWLTFAINNTLNADCWNSYSNSYNNPVNIYALDTLSMEITNDNIGSLPTYFYNYQIYSNTYVPRWPGYANNGNVALSFTNPLSATATLLTNGSGFYFGSAPPGINGFSTGPAGWESNSFTLKFPQLGLMVTNQLQLYMLDSSNGLTHVIDYVQFGGPQTALNVTEAIETNNPESFGYASSMWSQSLNKGAPWGILNQIQASEQTIITDGGANYWANTIPNQAQIQGFSAFMGVAGQDGESGGPYPSIYQSDLGDIELFTTNYVVQVPYTPTVTVSEYTSWQANDPLVHYLASDLTFNGVEKSSGVQTGTQITYASIGVPTNTPTPAFNVVNERYQPWGVQYTNGLSQSGPNAVVENPYSLATKDPLVWASDYWGFPTNLYPTVGWLGRVHRGTPWQTVYLKAHDVLNVLATNNGVGSVGSGTNTWANWTGDNNIVDLAHSAPVQDRLLFDLFTARPNDNAALGTLSVNQTNLAAWSAVFSGIVALNNVAELPGTTGLPSTFILTSGNTVIVSNSPVIIPPAGVNGYNSALGTLVTNINFARAGTNLTYGFTNADGVVGSFEHAGDILANPALTESSPFLNLGTSADQKVNLQQFGISDATYEWLPQQMMGLVRGTSDPRYVIYCYGQALRPAPNGLVTSASNFGLVTNYQVVAESVVRAVVSVHAQVNMSGLYPVTNYTTRVESYNVLPPE